ncbi:hypothetical protein EES47_29865 [Streptomyces sp. ADI98-12]|nr:hypothetical protein EES47_29865 [Streptomyces sp. ADI98-12]
MAADPGTQRRHQFGGGRGHDGEPLVQVLTPGPQRVRQRRRIHRDGRRGQGGGQALGGGLSVDRRAGSEHRLDTVGEVGQLREVQAQLGERQVGPCRGRTDLGQQRGHDRGHVPAGALQVGHQPGHALVEAGGVPGGHHEQPRLGRFRHGRRRRPLGEDDVRVGPAGTERADRRGPRHVRASRPRRPFALHPEPCGLPPHRAGQRVGVQRRYEFPMAQLKYDLGERRDAGRGLQMPDVRLDRPDRPGTRAGADPVEGLFQRGDLDRVAEAGAGAVRLQVAEVGGVDRGAPQRPGDQGGLRCRVRHGEPGGTAAVVDRGTADDGVHMVAVAQRVAQRAQQHHADALAGHVAVPALAEGAATPVGGQEGGLAQQQVLVRVHGQVDATGQGRLALPPADGLDGQVQRGQRGRAHAVQGDARSAQVQEVRHPVGDRRAERRGHRAWLRADAVQLVLVVHHPGEHADGPAAPGRRRMAGLLERVPRLLQEQPLLRVQHGRLVRRDVEEPRVEFVHPRNEPAPFAVRASRRPAVFGVDRRVVPAVGRHRADAVTAVAQVRPELVEVAGHRVAAADAHYGDRVVGADRLGVRLRRGELGRDPGRVPVQDHDVGAAAAHSGQQHVDGGRGLHPPQAHPAQRGVIDRHAAFRPGRPAHRHDVAAGAGEQVQERVRARVVGLTRIAPGAGGGRAEHQEVQAQAPGGRLEVMGAVDLGGEHRPYVIGFLPRQQPVTQHAGGVHHPVQHSEAVHRGAHRAVHVVRAGHVHHHRDHLGAEGRQLGGHGRIGRGAAAQDEPGVYRPGQMPGQGQPDPAEPSGDQVDAALSQRRPVRRCRHGPGEPDPAGAVRVAHLHVRCPGGQLGQRVGPAWRTDHRGPYARVLPHRGAEQARDSGDRRVVVLDVADQPQVAPPRADRGCQELAQRDRLTGEVGRIGGLPQHTGRGGVRERGRPVRPVVRAGRDPVRRRRSGRRQGGRVPGRLEPHHLGGHLGIGGRRGLGGRLGHRSRGRGRHDLVLP